MAKHALDFLDIAPTKRTRETPPPIALSPKDITSSNQAATVSGVIASVSPVCPTKYFDGKLTDGDTTLRIVGFRKQQQQCLQAYCKQQMPINILKIVKFN